jgi:2-polyprenyl-6-methoxyphenol hydroxylase-like FAD-dependent oxidoreductase
MRKAKRRALVVGGSMSGLLAALLLGRAGWDVDVFERVESELAGRGAGIVAQPDLIETLRRLGIDPTDLGVEVMTRKILDPSGGVAGEFACPQVLTAWERVYRLLRDAFPRQHYHRGRAVSGFVQTERSVLAQFADGGARAAGGCGWTSFHHPPAMPAAAGAALRRVRRLARAHPRGGVSSGDPPRAV